jgi:hypothetical protein
MLVQRMVEDGVSPRPALVQCRRQYSRVLPPASGRPWDCFGNGVRPQLCKLLSKPSAKNLPATRCWEPE